MQILREEIKSESRRPQEKHNSCRSANDRQLNCDDCSLGSMALEARAEESRTVSAADSTIYSIEFFFNTNRQRKRCQDDGIGGDMSEIGGDT